MGEELGTCTRPPAGAVQTAGATSCSMPTQWAGRTHVGHAADGGGDDPHSVHGDLVDHLLLQVPLIKAFSAICLEGRTEGSLLMGWQGACHGLGRGLLTAIGLDARILGLGAAQSCAHGSVLSRPPARAAAPNLPHGAPCG